MRSHVAILCSLFLIGCGQKEATIGSSSIDRSDTEPVTLRLKVKVGDTYRYKFASTIEAIEGNDKLEWTMNWDEEVTQVNAKSSTWTVRFHDVRIDDTRKSPQAKQRQETLEGLEAPMTFDPLGHAVGVEEGDSGATADLTFPEKPVKPGDTWEGEFGGAGPPMKITYTFIGRVTEEGKPSVLIEGMAAEGQLAKSAKPARFVVDVATGKIIRASGEFELGQPPKMLMSYTITQVEAGR